MLERTVRLATVLLLLVLLVSFLAPADAFGANLQISPVSISFRASQTAAGISLQNLGEQPLHGQVRVFAWDQKDGQDVLVPATDVVASPPIMEVAANSTQTVRLVRMPKAGAGVPGASEGTYRILIDEIPRGDAAANGVAIRLQYSVPVFILPLDAAAAPRLVWSVLPKDGGWILRVRNDGSLHAQIGATILRGAGGTELVVSKGLLGYALPGRSREWKLGAGAADLAGPVAIRTMVNAQALAATAGRD